MRGQKPEIHHAFQFSNPTHLHRFSIPTGFTCVLTKTLRKLMKYALSLTWRLLRFLFSNVCFLVYDGSLFILKWVFVQIFWSFLIHLLDYLLLERTDGKLKGGCPLDPFRKKTFPAFENHPSVRPNYYALASLP